MEVESRVYTFPVEAAELDNRILNQEQYFFYWFCPGRAPGGFNGPRPGQCEETLTAYLPPVMRCISN